MQIEPPFPPAPAPPTLIEFQPKPVRLSQNLEDIREQLFNSELEFMEIKTNFRYLAYLLTISVVSLLFTIFFAIQENGWAVLFGLIGLGTLGGFFGFGFIADDGAKLAKYNKTHAELRLFKLRLKQAEEATFQNLEPRNQFAQRVPETISTYRRKADKYRRWFTWTQLLTILLSALITSISGGWLDPYIRLPWLTPVLGLLVSILTGITLHFRFREKGYNLQQTADAIDLEYNAHRLGIYDYSKLDSTASLIRLSERVESLRDEQQKRQQQLEQSSQTDQTTSKPTGKAQRK